MMSILSFGFSVLAVFFFSEATSVTSPYRKLNYDQHNPNSEYSSGKNGKKIVASARNRELGIQEMAIHDITIFFQGMSTPLYDNDRLAFRGSTAMSLIDSVVSGNDGYVTDKLSLSTDIVDEGDDYIVCNFKITLEKVVSSSILDIEMMVKDRIVHAFSDPAFVSSYIRLLKLSSTAFRQVTDVALTKFTPEPTQYPSFSLLEYHCEGLVLDLYGINALNQVDRYLLKIVVEGFLLERLQSKLDYGEFETVVVKFSFPNDFFFNRMRMFMQVSVAARSNFVVPFDSKALKYLLGSFFFDNPKEFLKSLNVLRKGIYSSRISMLSDAPSAAPSSSRTAFPSSFPSSSIPSYIPSRIPTKLPSYNPSRIPSTLPSTFPSAIPSSSVPSKKPSLAPSMVPINSPSKTPSSIPSIFPSNYPSMVPSFAPFDQPSIEPSTKPTTQPSMEPTESKKPSSPPSKSSFPSKYPLKMPSENPSMAPTPCQDDDTYRSRYGFACHIHSYSICSRMGEVGFSDSEVNELTIRCRKSCDVCWRSSVPSTLPSESETASPTQIPSGFPTISPSLFPKFIPSFIPSHNPSSFLSAASSLPVPAQILRENYPPTFALTNFPTKEICLNEPLFTDKFGLSCEDYNLVDCHGIKDIGLTEKEVEAVYSACPKSCRAECNKSYLKEVSEDYSPSSCEDDPLFYDQRLGLSCKQHSVVECDKLYVIGFTKEEVDEIKMKCQYSCKKCEENSSNLFDITKNESEQHATTARAVEGNDIEKKSPTDMMQNITTSVVFAISLIVLFSLAFMARKQIKSNLLSESKSELEDDSDSIVHNFKSSDHFESSEQKKSTTSSTYPDYVGVQYETVTSPDDMDHSFIELTVGDVDEINIDSGNRVPNISGAFDLSRVASVIPSRPELRKSLLKERNSSNPFQSQEISSSTVGKDSQASESNFEGINSPDASEVLKNLKKLYEGKNEPCVKKEALTPSEVLTNLKKYSKSVESNKNLDETDNSLAKSQQLHSKPLDVSQTVLKVNGSATDMDQARLVSNIPNCHGSSKRPSLKSFKSNYSVRKVASNSSNKTLTSSRSVRSSTSSKKSMKKRTTQSVKNPKKALALESPEKCESSKGRKKLHSHFIAPNSIDSYKPTFGRQCSVESTTSTIRTNDSFHDKFSIPQSKSNEVENMFKTKLTSIKEENKKVDAAVKYIFSANSVEGALDDQDKKIPEKFTPRSVVPDYNDNIVMTPCDDDSLGWTVGTAEDPTLKVRRAQSAIDYGYGILNIQPPSKRFLESHGGSPTSYASAVSRRLTRKIGNE